MTLHHTAAMRKSAMATKLIGGLTPEPGIRAA